MKAVIVWKIILYYPLEKKNDEFSKLQFVPEWFSEKISFTARTKSFQP